MNINMFPLALVHLPPDVPLVFSFIAVIGIIIIILIGIIGVCTILTFFISLTISLIYDRIWPRLETFEHDIEVRRVRQPAAQIISYQTLFPAGNNNQALEIYDLRLLPNYIEEEEALRQKALEKLVPPVAFGSKETVLSCEDCSICLDNYKEGESCRVFPVCSHVFHLKCIDVWLKNHFTCPVCRRCLLEVRH